jgi:hypothetical protein
MEKTPPSRMASRPESGPARCPRRGANMSIKRLSTGWFVVAALAACAELPNPLAHLPMPGRAPSPEVFKERATPIPARVITIAANCSRTEEDGFREDAHMLVADNNVKSLSWKLWAGRHGSCTFNLADFKQTRQSPHIELSDTDGSACKLMVWQDPSHISLAHANCQRHCTAGAYDHAYPVMFDATSGHCAMEN